MQRWKITICLAFLGAGVTPGFAQDTAAPGEWSVIQRDQPQEEIDPLCILRSPESGGRYLQITNPAETRSKGRGNARLNLYFPGKVADGDRLDIPGATIQIDGKARWTSDMLWVKAGDANVITAIIETEVDRVIQPLAFGRTLSVQFRTDYGQFDESFPLRGSSKALKQYEECLAKVRIAPEGLRTE